MTRFLSAIVAVALFLTFLSSGRFFLALVFASGLVSPFLWRWLETRAQDA